MFSNMETSNAFFIKYPLHLSFRNPLMTLSADLLKLFALNSNFHLKDYPEKNRKYLNLESYQEAQNGISQWAGYAPTPLRQLDKLEKNLKVAKIWYKDESSRFGLNSFKALGGAYAVMNLLKGLIVKKGLADKVRNEDLLNGKYADFAKTVTVTSATDGNHGRSVAWGASLCGCSCVIYIHEHVSDERKKAIEQYEAEVVRVKGNYDFSVSEAESDAKKYSRFVVSDTTYPGYIEIPCDVMQGYTVMVQEVLDNIPDEPPTHIFIQVGVGGLPAAIAAHCWETYGKNCPKIILVEPENAACMYESLKNGEPVAVEGDLDTMMAGLACGEVSIIAFEILKDITTASLVISDDAAIAVMKGFADGQYGDKIVAGESAVAGCAGLMLCRDNSELSEKLGLDESSRILLFGTEGATDPKIYKQITGKTPEEIL